MRAKVIVAATLSLFFTAHAFAAGDCNRECRRQITHGFFGCGGEHTPASAPFPSNFRYTENAVDVALDQGLWKASNGLGQYQRISVDPKHSQTVYVGFIEENGQPAIVSLRLKIVKHVITEAEAIIGRKGVSLFDTQNFIDHGPSDELLARNSRTPRKDMIAAADNYFNGAQTQNPSIL